MIIFLSFLRAGESKGQLSQYIRYLYLQVSLLTEVSGTLTIFQFTVNVIANETRLVASRLGQLLGPLHLQRGGLNKAMGRNEHKNVSKFKLS